jgi:hypothetical protein
LHCADHRFQTKRFALGTGAASSEQIAGHKAIRSDLYSLGVMFFPTSARQLPFRGDSMAPVDVQDRQRASADKSEPFAKRSSLNLFCGGGAGVIAVARYQDR